jgi:type IV secretion system protein VirB9
MPVRYAVEAQRVEVEPPSLPPTVLVSEQRLEPGALPPSSMLQKRPTDVEPVADAKAAYEVVDAANRAAAQGPEASAYYNAIQEYGFTPGTLYQIYSAPTRVTDVVLQAGEHVEGHVVIGDMVRWVIGVTKPPSNPSDQQHVYIKPTRAGLSTNLIINTNRRSYFAEIHSYRESYMVAVKWRYPQDEIAQMVTSAEEQHEAAKSTTRVGNPADLNFHYARTILAGPARWAPTQVFDDGKKTYIHFPIDVTSGEVPVLFVMRGDEAQLVNYRAKRNTYIVDRVFDAAELRVGTKDQEIVRIERIQ